MNFAPSIAKTSDQTAPPQQGLPTRFLRTAAKYWLDCQQRWSVAQIWCVFRQAPAVSAMTMLWIAYPFVAPGSGERIRATTTTHVTCVQSDPASLSMKRRTPGHLRKRAHRHHQKAAWLRIESLERRQMLAAEVSLGVDLHTGSEASITVVTLTVTASEPVTGAQTVGIDVTGSRVTAADYVLSSRQISIPDGSTQGAATLTIQDDSIFEGPETATLTLVNPSEGITIGLINSQQISIIDDDPLDQAIDDVLNQTVARQTQGLQAQLANTFPTSGMWYYENFAMAAYWLNQRTDEADAGLIHLRDSGLYQADVEAEHFHWNAYLLERIYSLFSSRSEFPQFQGRMSVAAENAILAMLWNWAAPITEMGLASPDKIHFYWESENHDAQAWVSLWGAAQIFADHPDYQNRTYDDGSTPAAMATAFDDYLKAYVRRYTVKGLPIEIASPTYAKYTLNTWFNLYDFADDPDLKEAAGGLLDVYFADWALEQIDGVRGGSRHRSYPGRASISESGGGEHAWYVLGQGVDASRHPGVMSAATTFWRPSRAVVGLALDVNGRGSYGYTSRRLGLKDQTPPSEPPALSTHAYNPIDPDGGSLLRYTWSTPDFVMGMTQVEARPWQDWLGVSSQNRWNGVIFGGHDTARIFTQRPYPGNNKSVYNEEWGVQNKGVMVLQRLSQARSATGQMIWFDFSLRHEESDGWIFAEASDAFAAVRVVHGGFTWQPDTLDQHRNGNDLTVGQWAVLNDQFSPIIMEVARKQNYADFDSFKAEILDNTLTWNGTRLDYSSAGYQTALTHFADESAVPQVDGVPLDFLPTKAYESPYLQGDFGNGTVIIDYGDDRTIHGITPFADDTHTVALWHFDQASSGGPGTFYTDDVSASARTAMEAREHALSTDSISVIADGKYGNALRFDFETGDQYMITTSSDWPVDKGTFRFQGWFRLNPGDSGGYLAHVYDQVYLSVAASTATFTINKSGVVADNSPANRVSVSAEISASNGWQYIDAIYDGASIRLLTEVETVSKPGNGPFVPNVRDIYIGSRKNKSNFVGDMDEVKLSAPDAVTARDYGDAPATFPVTQASGGAAHLAVGPRLGPKRDGELDGQPSPGADGDDVEKSDDEDGVMFGRIHVGDVMAGVNIDLQNASQARIDAWLDFDGSGTWEADEKILDSILAQDLGPFETFNFPVNPDAIQGTVIARVRVSSLGNLSVSGVTQDGEVEDHAVTILPPITVNRARVNPESGGRSQVTSISVELNTPVDHSAIEGAFRLQHLGNGSNVGTIFTQPFTADGKTTVVLTFAGANTISRQGTGSLSNSLVDGNYQLYMKLDKVRGGTSEDENLISDAIFRLFGDSDGDRDVDFQDYGRFGLSFLKSSHDPNFNPSLDFDGDGDVDGTDLGQFRKNLLKSL